MKTHGNVYKLNLKELKTNENSYKFPTRTLRMMVLELLSREKNGDMAY